MAGRFPLPYLYYQGLLGKRHKFLYLGEKGHTDNSPRDKGVLHFPSSFSLFLLFSCSLVLLFSFSLSSSPLLCLISLPVNTLNFSKTHNSQFAIGKAEPLKDTERHLTGGTTLYIQTVLQQSGVLKPIRTCPREAYDSASLGPTLRQVRTGISLVIGGFVSP
jgi:hypothetical protein